LKAKIQQTTEMQTLEHPPDAPDICREFVMRASKHEKEGKQTGHLEEKKVTMYVHRVKIPLHKSAPA